MHFNVTSKITVYRDLGLIFHKLAINISGSFYFPNFIPVNVTKLCEKRKKLFFRQLNVKRLFVFGRRQHYLRKNTKLSIARF